MHVPAVRVRGPLLSRVLASVVLLFVCAAAAQAQQEPATPPPSEFKFTNVDLELLEKSNELDKYMEDKGYVYTDAELTEYITALGDDVLPPGDSPEHVVWRFHVVRDPIPNAFAFANGSIYVNSGLLALLENEAQLAAVLAHEETHVLNRHPYIENRSARKKAVAANVLAAAGAVGSNVGGIGGAAAILFGTLAPAIVESTVYGYSRQLEKEADIRAVSAVNQADYSTEEMIVLFKLLETSHEVDLSQVFYQDHPKLQDRVGYITEVVHQTPAHSHHPMVEAERYVAATEKISRDNIAFDIRAGRSRTATAVAQRLVKQNPKSSEDYRALGDALRALGPRTPEPTQDELSSKGKRDARKMETKFTDQEYDNALEATPAGKVALEASQKQSEEAYRRAIELDAMNATAHRGLGFLFEREHFPGQAAREFREYLALAPDAFDQMQIRRRIETAEKQAAPAPPDAPKP
jgi:beta-barrel assembly-enhancing protease